MLHLAIQIPLRGDYGDGVGAVHTITVILVILRMEDGACDRFDEYVVELRLIDCVQPSVLEAMAAIEGAETDAFDMAAGLAS